MPLIWKIPVLIIGALIIVLLILMTCRYSIKSPLLLSIEPSSSGSSIKKALKSKKDKQEPLPYPEQPTDPVPIPFNANDQTVWNQSLKKEN